MAKFNAPVLTDAGASIMARSMGGEGEIEFTRLSTGDGPHEDKTPEALAALTDLANERQAFPFNGYSVYSVTQVRLSSVITNESLAAGYYLNELGIFARIKGSGEEPSLYCIAVTSGQQGDFFPAYDSAVGVTQIIQSFILTVARASSVTVTVDSGAYALQANVGSNGDLETDERGTIVGAVNELKRAIDEGGGGGRIATEEEVQEVIDEIRRECEEAEGDTERAATEEEIEKVIEELDDL